MSRPTTILITGASTGIGAACALELDARSFRVLAGVRKQEDAERLKERSRGNLTPVLLDVTEPDSVARARERAEELLEETGLDGLVNNAGITVTGLLEFLPLDEIRRQFEVNLFGQIAVTQTFLPLLRRARGRIINMSSISGRLAAPMLGPYAMSKFALEAFSDALRRELHPLRLHVVCIEPGAIATPIWEKGISAARTRAERLPPEAIELYGPMMEAVRRAAEKMSRNAVPAERVARVVYRALTARKPKTRYAVGPDARVKLVRWLPDRVLDALTRWQLESSYSGE